MLENWYFCAALGMPVDDAATHLDIIAALREPPNVPRAAELVCDGLDSLLAVDSAAAVHALPYVLAAHRRHPESKDVAARADAVYRAIASVSHERLRGRLGGLLREAGGGSWDNAVDLLEKALAEVPAGAHTADPAHVPYLDLGEQLAPSVVLVVGRFLARHRPEQVLDRLAEPPGLLVRALRGEHGRLALVQAAEFQAAVWPDTAQDVRRGLAKASGGAFDMEPDLLAAAARVSFAPPPGERDPDALAAVLDLLENEALSGAALLGWVEEYAAAWDWGRQEAVARRQAAYVRLGGVAAQRDSPMPSVLWQSVVTDLAAELAPRETVRRIEGWWQPPALFPDKTRQVHVAIGYDQAGYGRVLRHVGRLMGLRLPPGVRTPVLMLNPGPVADTEPDTAARLWSPWLTWTPDWTIHGGTLTGDEPEQLVRLLAAALLAERLLTDGRGYGDREAPDHEGGGHASGDREAGGHDSGEQDADEPAPDELGPDEQGPGGHPDFLLLLTVHVRDVLGRLFMKLTRSIAEHQGRSLIPAGHLAGLITHTGRVVDRVGRGLRPTVRPDDMVAVLRQVHERPVPRQGHALRGFVHYKNGLNAALGWLKESSAGGVGPHRTEAGGRWFTGDVPAADALFELVAEYETSLSDRVAVEAALLRREVHGDTGAAHFRWDWDAEAGAALPPPSVNKSGAVQPMDHKILLLSSPTDPERLDFSVAEWESMGDALEREALASIHEKKTRALHVPLTVRTLRLAALLGQPELGDAGAHAEWVDSWAELVATLNSQQSLPRVVRGRLIDMFRSRVAGAPSQERLNAVLERVVDTVIELSPRATLYYDRLFGELGAELALPAESATLLRYRALRSFYHRWGHTAFPQAVTHPFDAYGSRISARGTEAALVALLRDTADREYQGRSVALGTVVDEAWRRTQEPGTAPARRQDVDAVDADPRRVLGATVDRRTAEAVLYLRGERLDTAVAHDKRVPVHDLFATGTDAELPGESFVLGIVVSSERTGGATELKLNCGLPTLVTRQLPRPDRNWTPGRTAAVKIAPGKRTAAAIAPLAAPEPLPGEVRGARLKSAGAYPWLALDVDGAGGYRYPSGTTARDIAARRRWDPDLSRAFAGPQVPERRVLVMWDAGERHWLPLDAGLPELAVAVAEDDPALPDAAGPDAGSFDGTGSDAPGSGGRGLLRLVLCGPATDRSGYGPAWRFSLTPGRTYVLGESAWDAEDWRTLNAACAAEPFGLIVHARFRPGENRLRLTPPAQDRPAIDRRNVQWLAAFTRAAADTADGGDTFAVDAYEEKAVRTTGADGIARWLIAAPAIDGFPRWVTARLGQQRTQSGSTLMCTVRTWGEPEARKAEAEVLPAKETGIELPRTAGNFAELLSFEPYSLVEIGLLHGVRYRDPATGSNPVRTAHGILGFADTDSLTLTGEFADGTASRYALVVSDTARPTDRGRRTPTPLPHDRFTEAAGPAVAGIRTGPGAPGLVARQIRSPEKTLLQVVLWLPAGNDVAEVMVPASAFDHGHPSAGDHVVARHDRAGWTFAVLRRTLRLRALWTLEAAPGAHWTPVGEVGVGDGAQYLWQHPRLPRVATTPTPGLTESTVPTAGRAHAQKADRRPRTRRAVVHLNGRSLVGNLSDATATALSDDAQAVHLDATDLFLDDSGYEIDHPAQRGRAPDRLVDVQRFFDLSPVARSARPVNTPPPRDTAADARADWERMLAAGTVTGQRTPDGHVLLPSGAAPDDSGTYRRWLVPADEPATMVTGRLNPYPADRVRCAFVRSGRGYRASFLRVPPVTAAAFMAEVLPQARPDGRRFKIRTTRQTSRRPYYVGVDRTAQGPVHRFEFGYGWFLDVPAPGLTVGGRPVDPAGLTLFHGDRIDAVSFGADTTGAIPGGITMDIALADITKGIESHVRREAEDRVVHLLDVDLDHVRDHVAVHRVHTGNRRLEPGREDVHDREERISADLDPADARALLAAHRPGSGRRRQILARMAGEPAGGPRLKPRFTLVLPYATEDGRQGLREGDSLYLSAGSIHQSVNNVFLGFELPGTVGLPETGADGDGPPAQDRQDGAARPDAPLTVDVGRRDFSHRENCLRRAVEAGGADVYRGNAKMLVRLEKHYDDGANRWRGSTKSPRPRPLPLLRSYLDITGADCFGVIAANGRSVELRPGVLFPTDRIRGAADIVPGSVVRLRRDGADGVWATTAIPADAAFLGDRPRPVVAFPKDDLRNRDALAMTDYPHHFTVAGLPGLTAGAPRSVAQGVLREAHPKIVGAVADGRRRADAVRLVTLRGGAMAARLVLPADGGTAGDPAVLRFVPVGADEEQNPEVAWADVSFMDGTAREIARACRERYWRYHDARTWQWRPGRDRPVSVPLPEQARADTEPVFFSAVRGRWTLRHEAADLRRFGFPATELVEDVRPERDGRRTVWAVARADRRSVWLETAPGRVVEVRSELVRSADGGSLADLDWSLFSPGDLVYGRVEGGVNECGHIVLDSWHAGVRGAFGSPRSRRMLLPVAFADEAQGALHLGEDGSSFPYPAGSGVVAAHPAGSAVWLDRENTLTALQDSPVAVGDVVLLSAAPGGGLRVLGLPQARVLIAGSGDRGDWPGTEWLRRLLTDAQRERGGLPAGLTAVPVTVVHTEDGRTPVLTVSRKGQPRGFAPNGSVLVRPLADLGGGYVAVRSGGALFRVAMTAMLPGLPRRAAAAAAAAFVADGGMVELHWDAELRSLTGAPAVRPSDTPAGASAKTPAVAGTTAAGMTTAVANGAAAGGPAGAANGASAGGSAAASNGGSAAGTAAASARASTGTTAGPSHHGSAAGTAAASNGGSTGGTAAASSGPSHGGHARGTSAASSVSNGGSARGRTGSTTGASNGGSAAGTAASAAPAADGPTATATATALAADATAEFAETTVRPLFSVDREDGRCLGVVCRDTQAHRLCWLPAGEAAWTADVAGAVLLAHLKRRRLDVVRTGPHTVSLVAHPVIARSHDRLTPGQRVRVTVVEPAPDETPADRPRRSLVAVEPAGVLARHTPADGPSPAAGESLQAEVARAAHADGLRTVSLVEPGSRLTVLDVPKWLAGALHRLHVPDAAYEPRQPVADLVPRRFHDYRASFEQGLSGTGAAPDADADPALRVLHALGRAESDREGTPQDKAEAAAAVAAWLCSADGEAVVRQRAREVDLAPLLAVCRLGGVLGRAAGRLPAGWPAYLLGRLGDRAVSSLHTEALVAQWLVRTARHREAADPWPRLRTVELKAELAAREVGAVLDFGVSVTGRPAAGLPESDAAPVARALLAAVGALPSADGLRGDSPILGSLADLGAAVRPATTEPAPAWPVPRLFTVTRRPFNQLISVADRPYSLPLTLLPAYLPLTAPMHPYADRLLRTAATWRA